MLASGTREHIRRVSQASLEMKQWNLAEPEAACDGSVNSPVLILRVQRLTTESGDLRQKAGGSHSACRLPPRIPEPSSRSDPPEEQNAAAVQETG